MRRASCRLIMGGVEKAGETKKTDGAARSTGHKPPSPSENSRGERIRVNGES